MIGRLAAAARCGRRPEGARGLGLRAPAAEPRGRTAGLEARACAVPDPGHVK